MISSLLKNRGLRLQLLVGLLLVLGAFPKSSEGLECYYCNDFPIPEGPDAKELAKELAKYPKCKQPEKGICEHGVRHCGSLELNNGVDGKQAQKGCSRNEEADCIKAALGSNCLAGNGREGFLKAFEKVSHCQPTRAGQEGRAQSDPVYVRQCVCDTDLCNGDGICGESEDTCVTPSPSDSASVAAIHHHPFNRIIIIITILTVTFYNYL